ncbi:MAG: type I-G CRISPR-associated protein Cas8g1/Csx17, partial [Candidatus Thorarchaeota archaeon]
SPIPLAHYLKALGVFRLVAEQKDPDVRGYWKDDRFHIVTKLTKEELVDFFLNEYKPTPIVVPWSGSDFFKVNWSINSNNIKYNKVPTAENVIEAFLATHDKRLSLYRETINDVYNAMSISGISKKEDIEGNNVKKKIKKNIFIQSLRNIVSEDVVQWVDAACIIGNDQFHPNNLLGSGGGSDGNSHFSDNFMQSLWMVLPEFNSQRSFTLMASGRNPFNSQKALMNSLFNETNLSSNIPTLSPALFDPHSVGAMNSTSGFSSKALSNPWNYILMLEGSLLFSGNMAKKFGSSTPSSASFPFLVNLSNVGNGGLSIKDSGKEIWLPLWLQKIKLNQCKSIFLSSRLEVHGRIARDGLDAFQSIAQLGVDSGIVAFQRIGLLRGRIGGENYFTTFDLGKVLVKRQPQIDLIKDIDTWLDKFRRKVSSDNVPNSIKRYAHRLEGLIMDLCKHKNKKKLLSILIELGKIEIEFTKSTKWTQEKDKLKPIPLLSKRWINECYDGSVEFRLALSLASLFGYYKDDKGKNIIWPIRSNLEPISLPIGKYPSFKKLETKDRDVVSTNSSLVDMMNSILSRRLIRAQKSESDMYSDMAHYHAHPGDIARFIEGDVNDEKIRDLFIGLSLINWAKKDKFKLPNPSDKELVYPDSLYMVMKLCYAGTDKHIGKIPINPQIHRRCQMADGTAALKMAIRRLRGSGIVPAIGLAYISPNRSRRIAASLLFPIDDKVLSVYLNRIGWKIPEISNEEDIKMEVYE